MKKQNIVKDGKFFITKDVSLPVNTDGRSFVPPETHFVDHGGLMEQVGNAIKENMPVLLVGETGTGKTSLIRYLANKTGNGFRRNNYNGSTTPDDVIGKILINKDGTYWVDGVLIDAMRNGYWYLADEINGAPPEILFSINSLLDDDGYIVLAENNGEIVRPHPNFRFFAAMNPSEDYAGAREMNKALMSRFVVFNVGYPTPSIEAGILKERTGIREAHADLMVKFANELRATHRNKKIQFAISTRDLIQWARMYNFYGKFIVSAQSTVLNKTSRDDETAVKDHLAMHFKEIDAPRGAVKKKDASEEVIAPVYPVTMTYGEYKKIAKVGDEIEVDGNGNEIEKVKTHIGILDELVDTAFKGRFSRIALSSGGVWYFGDNDKITVIIHKKA